VTRQRKATLFALAAVLCWSTVPTAFKLALRHIDHFQLLSIACGVALVFLGAVLTVQGKAGLLRRVSGRQLGLAALLGLFNPFLYYVILLKAYDLLPAQVAQPLNYTWALTLVWLSIPLLKQKPRLRDLLAGLVCYLGVVVISTGGDPGALRVESPLGVALALISTIFWALYWIGNTRNTADPVLSLFLNFACGLPMVLGVTMIFSDLRIDTAGLPAAVYVGVVEMGLGFVLWLTALKMSETTARVANLIFISPFLSLVFIQFVLGERIVPGTLVGLVLIVGGLVWQQRGR
jgi:drug/metabolite transporter (DMT)-like permease